MNTLRRGESTDTALLTQWRAAGVYRRRAGPWERRHNLTAYDAAFLTLAEAREVSLVTRDRRLSEAPGHCGPGRAVPVGPAGRSRRHSVGGARSSWPPLRRRHRTPLAPLTTPPNDLGRRPVARGGLPTVITALEDARTRTRRPAVGIEPGGQDPSGPPGESGLVGGLALTRGTNCFVPSSARTQISCRALDPREPEHPIEKPYHRFAFFH